MRLRLPKFGLLLPAVLIPLAGMLLVAAAPAQNPDAMDPNANKAKARQLLESSG